MTLAAAIDEWISARNAVKGITLSDAVRFYEANRTDLPMVKNTAQVTAEFVKSRARTGVSAAYVNGCRVSLKRFTDKLSGNIGEITTADINKYLADFKCLGPVGRNGHRRNIVTMVKLAKKQGYLHPNRKTAAEQTEKFKEPETEFEISTPDEITSLLVNSHARILPVIAIGAFAGIRSAEIMRLDWEDN